MQRSGRVASGTPQLLFQADVDPPESHCDGAWQSNGERFHRAERLVVARRARPGLETRCCDLGMSTALGHPGLHPGLRRCWGDWKRERTMRVFYWRLRKCGCFCRAEEGTKAIQTLQPLRLLQARHHANKPQPWKMRIMTLLAPVSKVPSVRSGIS